MPDQVTLLRRLQDAANQVDPPEVHVQPDRMARYDSVAAVLSTAAIAGMRELVASEAPRLCALPSGTCARQGQVHARNMYLRYVSALGQACGRVGGDPTVQQTGGA